MTKKIPMSVRIAELIDSAYGGNKSSFARAAGISESSVRSYLGGTMPKADVLEKIVDSLAISCEWLLMGRGNMYDNVTIQHADLEVKDTFPLRTDGRIVNQTVPLYPLEATAGVVAVFSDIKPVPVDYLSLPDLPPVDGAVYVRGDSMYPLLKSGDIVLYKQVHDLQYGIFWGEMYLISAVIDGDAYVTIKYVHKSEKAGHIKLVSQNAHHEPKDIPLEMVRAMAIVKASVRYNTIG